jgi:hypothetical protein
MGAKSAFLGKAQENHLFKTDRRWKWLVDNKFSRLCPCLCYALLPITHYPLPTCTER